MTCFTWNIKPHADPPVKKDNLFHVEHLPARQRQIDRVVPFPTPHVKPPGPDNLSVSYPDPPTNAEPNDTAAFPALGDRPDASVARQALGHLADVEQQLTEMKQLTLDEEQGGDTPWINPEGLGLASILAHEINNLLTPLGIYASRAKRDPGNADLVLNALDRAGSTIDRVGRLTETILDLARSATSDPTPTTCDAQRVADAVIESLDLTGSDANISIECDLELCPDLPIEAGALERVLTNLANNAHQAMQRSGQGTLIRILAGVDDAGIWVVVEDDGPGIDPTIVGSLFNPWVKSVSGHGLGLSLCRELILRAGGSLEHETVEPSGCRFVIRF
ncbi:sensor histidine kinase [Mucisphaera calidilacus]|uniref:histidine kinase n=1 Tax=Mucisphaera calidilacus TaxID=2527982 RepID=A0A518C0I6_9BACT|nr:HAMP domain-containing sensor histidine kinase [Mucisphaera calidilacus]QDU72742.1 Sensor protein ZraS [Mucisphaera calidilacus]